MSSEDSTRIAGATAQTRIANTGPKELDATRIAQEGYESRLAREPSIVLPVADEFYKIGATIGGRYEVSAVHHGAMGVVYGCFDHETKLPRALKTVRARYATDKQVLSMFESEAFVWVSLEKHPYIVRAYRVDRFNNAPFVITEYVCGPEGMEGDLRGWLGHSRLTLSVAVTMALQIAQGMQHAVRKMPDLVHRDLKPANILVNSEGKAMVTDFGLVNAAQTDAGTPAYMSPEQWRGEDLDMRSDIYAYGCILFEMFTAHRLFAAATDRDWEIAHLEQLPVAFASSVQDIPSEIDHFLCRCLRKEREARPQTWDEVVVFFAEWYHRLTGKAVVLDFSRLVLSSSELFDAGFSLVTLHRNEEAILAYDRALAIDPNLSAAWNNKGDALSRLKRYDEALQALDRALVIDTGNASAWINTGIALGGLKRYDEAIQAIDRALVIDPSNSAFWNSKGVALNARMRYEDAIVALDKALLIDPNSPGPWTNKGNALLNLNRNEEAIKAFGQSIMIDPNDSTLWFNNGTMFIQLKRYDEAIQALDRALAIDPSHPDAWLNKGNAHNNLKSYEDALHAYDRVSAIDPSNSAAWNNKGKTLVDLKRYEDAIAALDQALAIDKNYSSAWWNKGLALDKLKRYEDALSAYDQALQLDPNNSGIWCDKAITLIDLYRNEEAINAYERALFIDPNNCIVWCNKGIVLNSLKRYLDAINAYDHALKIDPMSFSACYNKGNALFKLARYPEAVAAYDRSLKINPSGEYALRSRQAAIAAMGTSG